MPVSMELPALPSRTVCLGIAAIFFIVAIAVYGVSLDNGFVHWDDGLLIYQNPAVIDMSWSAVKRAFTTYDPELYVPLTLLSYQVDYAVGQGSPWPFHAQNLMLHTLNALGVCWLAFLLLKRGNIALFLGFLFLLHPLHTEAVAWASARKDVLATFFFLTSLISFFHYREKDNRWLYWLSVGLFGLGLMAKVVIVTLPVVLLLLLWRERGKVVRRDIAECLPFFMLSVVFGIVAIFGKTDVAAASSLVDKVLLAIRSTAFYLGKFVLPLNLSVLYPVTDPVRLLSPLYFIPLIIVTSITIIASISMTRTREIIVWWIFYVLTLSPTFINIAKGDKGDLYVASDRYAYIPSIGLLLFLGWVVTYILERASSARLQRQSRRQAAGAAVVVLAAFAYLAAKQSLVWHDTKTLFEHAIAHAIAPSYAAHTNVGNAYRQEKNIDRAIEEYRASLAIKPHPRTYANLGAAQRQLGQFDAAFESYNNALSIDPDFVLAHFGLGIVYAAQGRHDQAFAAYDRTLALDPKSAEVYTNIGALRMQRGETDLAIAAYEKAIEVEPTFPVSYYNLAVALVGLERFDEAVAAYERAVQLNPRSISTRINLGILYARLGKIEEATDQFQAILRMDPNNSAALSALEQLGAHAR
jgi:protein O-mannosyl-transferase